MLDDQQLSFRFVSDLVGLLSLIAKSPLDPQAEKSSDVTCKDAIAAVRQLCHIAQNSSLPDFILKLFATHPSWEVREAVSDNPSLPLDYIEKLAYDEHVDVRYAIAENHRTPALVLAEMCADDNPYISHRASLTLQRVQAECLFSAAQKALGIETLQFKHTRLQAVM